MKKLSNLSLSDIKKLSAELAKKYKGKDVVIGLTGPLGAGKTAFVKSFASNYGITNIKSPTFIICSLYQIPNQKLYHYDFYRLEEEKQLVNVGFTESLHAKNRIMLIEWADKFPMIQNHCDVVLNFEIVSKKLRNVTIK